MFQYRLNLQDLNLNTSRMMNFSLRIRHACCLAQTIPECRDLTVHGENEVNNKEIELFYKLIIHTE